MHDKSMIDFKALARFQHLINAASIGTQVALRPQLYCSSTPMMDKGTAVPILLSKFKNGERRAHFGGLMTCNNAWSCPHCSAIRIIEYRERITQVCEAMNLNDYWGVMFTLTIPHVITDSASTVFTRLMDSRRLFNNAGFADFMKAACRGKRYWSFTATECKYSRFNGWHFHQHVLYFVPKQVWHYIQRDDVKTKLQGYWNKAMIRAGCDELRVGGNPMHISGNRIMNGDYIAKEMCKPDNDKKRSCSPIDLLNSDDPRDNQLYLEFALATKGFPRFRGSQGLWQFADPMIVKKNVQERNEYIETVVVGSFTFTGWNEIIRDEYETGVKHRLNMLRRAELDGGSGVMEYCFEHLLPIPLLYGKHRKTWHDGAGGFDDEVANEARRSPFISTRLQMKRAFRRASKRYGKLQAAANDTATNTGAGETITGGECNFKATTALTAATTRG